MTETAVVGPFTDAVDNDLNDVRTFTGEAYNGRGQIKYPSTVVSETTAASRQVATMDPILKIPVGAPNTIRPGHMVRVTASTADNGLVTREYRVKALPVAGQVSAHRYGLEELS